MKIHEYNEMMAYLLRPAQEAKLVDDLEPGSLKDELLKDFDPSQETYEEYLQRKSMRENAAQGGVIGKPGGLVEPGVMYYGRTVDLENLDTEILESDWFKKNYPDVKTIKEASGDQPVAKVRNQYRLAKERGFPISQKQLADEIGIPKSSLSDYISYAQTSKKPKNPDDISRIKRAKEFVNLLKNSGITFTGGGQRFVAGDIRFTANPEQIDNFKKTYQENFMTKFTKEQKQLLNDTVRSTYDDMIKSGNVMDKVNFAKLLNTKVDFGSYNAMKRAIDRVLSKKEINAFPKPEFVSGGQREITKRKSIQMAGEDANKIRKSQDKFLNAMRSDFKNLSDKNLLKLIKNNPKLKNQVTLRFDKKAGEFFNQNIDDLDIDTIRMRSQPNVEHIKKIAEAGQQAEWPYNRQVAVRNINGHIKESVEGFINDKEPLLKRKDIPLETKEKIKNQILNIENKMNDMSLRMYAGGKYRGVDPLKAIDRETGQLTSFFENVKSMGLDPKTFSAKIPSKFKPFAVAAGLTGGMITAAAAGTESPEQASNLLEKTGIGAGVAGGAYAARKPILKTLGKTANVAFGPVGVVGLNYALGVDPKETIDRVGLEAEAALAPSMVRGATSITDKIKNPLARKTAELLTTISPKYAMRAARIASPLGIASLGLEGLYQYGKFAKDEIAKVKAMTPEERNFYNDLLMDEGGLLD